MHPNGAYPKEEREFRLSAILEDSAPQKYYLSEKACQGILRRAEKRGKQLPELMKQALLDMIEYWHTWGQYRTHLKYDLEPPEEAKGP